MASGEVTEPSEDAAAQTRASWNKKSMTVKRIIKKNIANEDYLREIIKYEHGKDIYVHKFEGGDTVQCRGWYYQLNNEVPSQFKSLSAFITSQEALHRKLKIAGKNVDEDLAVSRMLFTLPKEFKETRNRILGWCVDMMTFNEVGKVLQSVVKANMAADDTQYTVGQVLHYREKEKEYGFDKVFQLW